MWSSYSDAKWCIDNDYQVYIKPDGPGARICVRHGGISSCGKDNYYDPDRKVWLKSKEVVGQVYHKSQEKAQLEVPSVYKYLRQRHEGFKRQDNKHNTKRDGN